MKRKYLIGEVVARFYLGETFRFEYMGAGEFKQVTGGIVPACIRDELLGKDTDG